MNLSITFFPWKQEGMMAVEVPQNEEISGVGKMDRKKSRFCYPLKKTNGGA